MSSPRFTPARVVAVFVTLCVALLAACAPAPAAPVVPTTTAIPIISALEATASTVRTQTTWTTSAKINGGPGAPNGYVMPIEVTIDRNGVVVGKSLVETAADLFSEDVATALAMTKAQQYGYTGNEKVPAPTFMPELTGKIHRTSLLIIKEPTLNNKNAGDRVWKAYPVNVHPEQGVASIATDQPFDLPVALHASALPAPELPVSMTAIDLTRLHTYNEPDSGTGTTSSNETVTPELFNGTMAFTDAEHIGATRSTARLPQAYGTYAGAPVYNDKREVIGIVIDDDPYDKSYNGNQIQFGGLEPMHKDILAWDESNGNQPAVKPAASVQPLVAAQPPAPADTDSDGFLVACWLLSLLLALIIGAVIGHVLTNRRNRQNDNAALHNQQYPQYAQFPPAPQQAFYGVNYHGVPAPTTAEQPAVVEDEVRTDNVNGATAHMSPVPAGAQHQDRMPPNGS